MLAIALALGYLLGSLPIAYLVARAWDVNILRVGTLNPGAANVFREVSRVAGAIVFAGETAKGAAAVLVAKALGVSDWGAYGAGVAALVGHWLPLFLRFRGGMGLAPTMGIAYGFHPLAATIVLPLGLVILRITRKSVLTVAAGFAVFLLVAPLLGLSLPLTLAIVGVPLFVAPRRYLVPWVVQRLRRRQADASP